jgi:hypothetical protein
MTEQQSNMVAPILSTILNEDIREFANVLIDGLPAYIWEVGASSTDKYHPAYSLGVGGLMRHQIAVVRFLNYFFELEQYNTKFTSREMDLMRIAGLIHDGRKSGEQTDYERSKFTKFDHPIQMANVIRSYDGQYLSHDELEFIAHCIESHMGQWNTDRKSSTVLTKPADDYQYFVHLADYLASRKDLTMSFDNVDTQKTTPVNVDDIDKYPYDRPDLWEKIQYLPDAIAHIQFYEKSGTSKYDEAQFINYLKNRSNPRSNNLRKLKTSK